MWSYRCTLPSLPEPFYPITVIIVSSNRFVAWLDVFKPKVGLRNVID